MHDTASCPACSTEGHRVKGATVKSLLAISLREVREVPYRFCANANCDVVYYSDDGAQSFTTDQVRERVYQKAPSDDDVLICYCFRHTLGDLRQQFAQATVTTIIDDINAGIQAGQCACDWRNPQGNCCLGNVCQFIRHLQSG